MFAQLAEELRKDGELEDAIRVAREGLQKHPAYPSARMTLGRALLDTGDWAAARAEFELVLKSAADNILASRYLGECLENLGERDAAIARYKATLAMAPGEKHVVARLAELEKGGGGPAKPAAPAPAAGPLPSSGLRPGALRPPSGGLAKPPQPAAVPPPPPAPAPVPPPPIQLATVEGEMELETSRPATGGRAEAAPPLTGTFPIPLVAADEEFELERPYESPTTGIGISPAAPAQQAAPAPAPVPAPAPAPGPAASASDDQEFELEAPHEAPSVGWAATIRPLPVAEEPPATRAIDAPVAPAAPSAPPAPAAVPAPPPAPRPPAGAEPLIPATLTSPTLGELYFNQGFTDKAIEVYRDLAAREPENERLQARLRELEKLHRSLSGTEPAPPPAPAPPPPPPPMAAPVTPPPVAAPPTPPPMAAPPTPPPMAAPPPPPPPTTALPVTAPPPPAELSPAERPAADRREAIERTIARLEGLLSAIRKG